MSGPGPTGVPGFGTNEVFHGQQWGAFPLFISPLFSPIAWTKTNTDGTFASSSGNLTMFKGSTGIYTYLPSGSLAGIPVANLLAIAITSNNVPAVPSTSYGVGPGSLGVEVNLNLWSGGTAVPADEAHTFFLWFI